MLNSERWFRAEVRAQFRYQTSFLGATVNQVFPVTFLV